MLAVSDLLTDAEGEFGKSRELGTGGLLSSGDPAPATSDVLPPTQALDHSPAPSAPGRLRRTTRGASALLVDVLQPA